MRDKNLCASCKFSATCKEDMKKIFASRFNFKTKHRGASLLSLMVFFFAALVITAQVFFFSNNSAESVREDRDIQSVRMQLASVVEQARTAVKANPSSYKMGTPPDISWKTFFDDTRKNGYFLQNSAIKMYVNIHDLSYKYKDETFDEANEHWTKLNERIFPAIKDEDCFLIRAYREMPAGNNFMIQALIDKDGSVKTYEEIWY